MPGGGEGAAGASRYDGRVDVPRYRSPRLVTRTDKGIALVWIGFIGYSVVTGDWEHLWWRPLFGLSVFASLFIARWEQRRVDRERIDRLVARVANNRERRRAMKAARWTSG